MRKLSLPVVVAAAHPILSAELKFTASDQCETIELTVQNGVPEAGQATITAPAGEFPSCRTPMRLLISDECGCWETLVDVPTKEQPTVPGTYTGTGGVVEPIVTCVPDPDPAP